MRCCVNEVLMIGWSLDMLGSEVLSGMKEEFKEGQNQVGKVS